MSGAGLYSGRPVIGYSLGEFTHNGSRVRVVMRRDLISVGCSDITPDALRKLLAVYDEKFPKTYGETYVIQA